MYVDFAENWSVILPGEIQSYHWQSNQISIFTSVTYSGNETRSYDVVSDDKVNDTAHAVYATKKIEEHVKFASNAAIMKLTVVSDGAASHFKNRFQFQDLKITRINLNNGFSRQLDMGNDRVMALGDL